MTTLFEKVFFYGSVLFFICNHTIFVDLLTFVVLKILIFCLFEILLNCFMGILMI